jgi:hypothetical protein
MHIQALGNTKLPAPPPEQIHRPNQCFTGMKTTAHLPGRIINDHHQTAFCLPDLQTTGDGSHPSAPSDQNAPCAPDADANAGPAGNAPAAQANQPATHRSWMTQMP